MIAFFTATINYSAVGYVYSMRSIYHTIKMVNMVKYTGTPIDRR